MAGGGAQGSQWRKSTLINGSMLATSAGLNSMLSIGNTLGGLTQSLDG